MLFSRFTLVSRLGFSSSLTLPDIAALRFGIGGMLLLPVFLRYGLSGLRWRDAAVLLLAEFPSAIALSGVVVVTIGMTVAMRA